MEFHLTTKERNMLGLFVNHISDVSHTFTLTANLADVSLNFLVKSVITGLRTLLT